MSECPSDSSNLPSSNLGAQASKDFSSPLDKIAEQSNPQVVLAMVHVIWPAFIEVNGCILLPWVYERSTFYEWWDKLEGDCAAIEVTLNHLHMWDLFNNIDSAEYESDLVVIANILCKSWYSAAHLAFPEKEFVVSYSNEESDYGPTIFFSTKT